MTEIPDDVLCTSDHLWIRPGNGSRVRLGVTSVLLDHFGPVESVSLPVTVRRSFPGIPVETWSFPCVPGRLFRQ